VLTHLALAIAPNHLFERLESAFRVGSIPIARSTFLILRWPALS
jgi:hypothetical protein